MNFDAIYPGMLDSSKEYFTKDGNLFLITNGKVQQFNEVEAHEELELLIETEPRLKQKLTNMVGENLQDQQEQLAKCRFGGLNFSPDFSNDSKSTSDHIDCPKREVTELEINLLKELATEKKNEAIASDLNLPLGTFNVSKTQLYRKLDIYNKPQSVFVLIREGLL